MEEQRLNYLLERFLADEATVDELQELSKLLKADTDSELFKTRLAEMMQRESPAFPANGERWQQMVQDIVRIDKQGFESTRSAGVFRLRRWTAAAAVLLSIGLGGYFWVSRRNQAHLASADIAVRDSVIITVPGEQREVVLPDGSHVWLNAASSIRFPVSFGEGERSVELSGEAFFDVQHADAKAFHVHSGGITTTVLGTTFDIRAYPGQKNKVISVQSGKVKVLAGSKVLAILEKGRQVKVAADTAAYQREIDTLSVAAWRTGNLIYKDEMLEDITADLQRVFKAPIEIKSPSLKKVMITVSFSKKAGLQSALEMICRTTESRLSNKNGVFIIE